MEKTHPSVAPVSKELLLPAGAAHAQGGTPGSPGPPQGDTAAQSLGEDTSATIISLLLPPCRAQGPLLLVDQKPSLRFVESWNYRIKEFFTLAKTHQAVQPVHPALPRPPLNSVPKCHFYTSFKSFQVVPPVLGLDNHFSEEIFPNIQPLSSGAIWGHFHLSCQRLSYQDL